MAATKLTGLTAITSVTTDDLLYAVDDPSGTPASKKVTFDNLQKSITVVGGASGVSTQGDVTIPSNKYFYIGDSSTNGSWRFYISGGNLVFEKRESGSWNEKGAITA
jgi:hypothetical protein